MIDARLPSSLQALREDAGAPVDRDARISSPGLLLQRDANRGVGIADRVRLQDPRGLGRRSPAKLLSDSDRALRIEVELRGGVGGAARDPVIGEAEISAAPAVVADARNEESRGAVLLRGPDEPRGEEDGDGTRAERDVLHPGVVVQRDVGRREVEGPLRLRQVAGSEDSLLDPVGGGTDLLDRLRDHVVVGREVRGRVLEAARLVLDAEHSVASGQARRALVDDYVAVERRGLRREVVPRPVGGDLDVLVLDRDFARALPENVLLVVDRVLRRESDFAALLGHAETDLEGGLRLETGLERVGRSGGSLSEDRSGREQEHDCQGRRAPAAISLIDIATAHGAGLATTTNSATARSGEAPG